MGKTIVSWSPIHGQGAITSNVAALAAYSALTSSKRALITHTQLNYSSLELLFGKQLVTREGFEDAGMAALERLIKSNLLKPNAVMDYTETIYADKLDLLGGSNLEDIIDDKTLKAILNITKDAYDHIWIDAHSGRNSELTRLILSKADLVIVNLPQNRFVLDRFFNGMDFPEELKGRNYIIVISQYDKKSSFTTRKIKRMYKTQAPVFQIPYSQQFKDACNTLNVTEWFYRLHKSTVKDSAASNFRDELENIVKYIHKTLADVEADVEEGEMNDTN
ncbi:hypothetical protein [Solibacillus sp. FSL W7-1324]|uniref:hypothetical protein n=1 Tax=Solibacillus sp. FSL W7-1324 TaxID=2921701 RepID=UPI0030F67F94